MTEEKEDYNPYCELCTGCGEDGCCSHLACFSALIQNPKCAYGITYLRDARYANEMAHLGADIVENLKDKKMTVEEAINEYELKSDSIYNEIYEK